MKYLPPKFNVMFKFNYSKYNPRGLIFGGLIHGRSFPFQKLVPKRPGAYARCGLLSEFYGMNTTPSNAIIMNVKAIQGKTIWLLR